VDKHAFLVSWIVKIVKIRQVVIFVMKIIIFQQFHHHVKNVHRGVFPVWIKAIVPFVKMGYI
jgi:hypothetical protein